MSLFNNYNEIEQELLEYYSQMFTETGIPDARKTAKNILDQAIEESKKEGTYNMPSNSGDMLLEKEKSDEKTRQILRKKRDEGVRDEDIRWWWNMNDIERRIMLKTDEMNRMVLFMKEIQDSTATTKELAAKKASDEVRKFHPIYGDPDNTTHTKGDDRPLPAELKDRINIYIEKRFKSESEKYKKDIESSSTFNALIRKEIKAGDL